MLSRMFLPVGAAVHRWTGVIWLHRPLGVNVALCSAVQCSEIQCMHLKAS